MIAGRASWRRIRNASLVLLAVSAGATVMTPAHGAEPGDAGTDTSLPATSSAVTVSGRGPFADLRITVNQTAELVNQAISVTWTGGEPTLTGVSRFDGNYLQIMQCWGDPDGTMPDNPGPPPEQCVQGAADSVYGGRYAGSLFPGGGFALERIVSREDWPGYDESVGVVDHRTGYVWKSFRSVTGATVDVHYDPSFSPAVQGGDHWLNSFFNSITTNEVFGGRTTTNGTGAELFEVTTGLESSGLGCGQRVQPVDGGTKVPQCWLVVVPRGDPAVENAGSPFGPGSGVMTSPLAPAAWANRIAIPLSFNPVDSSCDLSDDQRRISGGELAVAAVTSWQPALCAAPGRQPVTYASVGESLARQQLLGGMPGGPGMAVVSRPLDPAAVGADDPVVYAPLTASGLVVAFNVERLPRPDGDEAAQALRGVRVANINLTPRLVAKLLTQSYRQQTAIKGPSPYEWARGNPPHLGLDPDFLRFNPEFEMLLTAGGKNFGGLLLPTGVSDVPRQVWEWVLADPEAKQWLDGAPDEHGMVVNPVYATTAAANPSGVAFGQPTPMTFPKSDPYCYQGPPQGNGGAVVPPVLCGADWLPPTSTMLDAARLTRAADDGAKTLHDPFAISSDQVYKRDGPQAAGSRSILSLTTTAAARRYGLQVARLSRAGDGGTEREFLAPTEVTLTAGIETMRTVAEPAVLEPAPTVEASGAYPLTSLTYAAVAPLRLDVAARDDFAALLDHAAGPGQTPGLGVGQLPPGYVPLPSELLRQTADAARAVRELQPTAPAEPTAPSSAVDPGAGRPVGAPAAVGRGGTSTAAPAVGDVLAPLAEQLSGEPDSLGVLTPILALARNRFVLPILASITLLSALGALEITKRPRRARPTSATGAR